MRTLALLALLACACTPRHATIEAPPPVPDAADGAAPDDAARACAVLADAGCPVGFAPNCADALRTDQAQGVGSQVDLGCILTAGPNRGALARCNVTCQ